jgi:hypothetical protein
MQTPLLSEKHHAVLFALIGRQTIQNFGSMVGEGSIRRAIQQYGNERGKRMALRAQAMDQELTMTNYLIFGEWQPSGFTETNSVMEDAFPDVRMKVTKCPWNDAWIEHDLLQYGKIYCQEIDDALLQGFNPELTIEMGNTLSNQGQPCEFVYRNASLHDTEILNIIQEKRLAIQKEITMPWDYHCGHLYKVFNQILIDEHGATGQQVMQDSLEDFRDYFGNDIVQIITSFRKTDFKKLPE